MIDRSDAVRSGMAPKPYYQSERVTLYCGDAREILPNLSSGSIDSVITDPVWPNSHPKLAGADRPVALWREVVPMLEPLCRSLVVHLGIDSDPRQMLAAVTMPFLCVQWLQRNVPGYKGRLLLGADVAYGFGEYPSCRVGYRCMPNQCLGNTRPRERENHPCQRNREHVEFLVNRWVEQKVLDPFAGTGTTLIAAVKYGKRAMGIEINPDYCAIAKRRIQEAEQAFALFEPAKPETQASMF